MTHLVIAPHRNEYPTPIRLKKGDALSVGERYKGPEAWADWYLCTADGQAPGWVPSQVIDPLGQGLGRALQDYSAQELDVEVGERLQARHALNGWLWCVHAVTGLEGWVPEMCLREVETAAAIQPKQRRRGTA